VTYSTVHPSDHRLVPSIRHRLRGIASPDVIEIVVELVNSDPLSLDECGLRIGVGHCVRPRGHEFSRGDETHVNLFGQTKHGDHAVRSSTLF
jgi:hypothetical protein